MVTCCSTSAFTPSEATTTKLCDSADSKSAAKSALVVTSPVTASILKPKLSSARLKVTPALVSRESSAEAA
jgi:hypothetical protein